MAPPELPPVEVRMTAQWTSGTTTMNVNLTFAAATLDDALRLVKRASSGAPLFRDPDSPEEVLS